MKLIKFCLLLIFITIGYLFAELTQNTKLPILFSQTERFVTELTEKVKPSSKPSLKEPTYIDYTYLPQGIAIVIDRANGDYWRTEEKRSKDPATPIDYGDLPALPIDLDRILMENTTAPVLTSKPILVTLMHWYLSQEDEKDKRDFAWLKKSWRIKEVDDFYLMLPLDWAKQPGYKGIKNNLKDVSWEEVKSFVPSEINTSPFTDILSKVFINVQELKKSKDHEIPSWMVFLSGHGSKEASIADFSLEEFTKFTNFLETKIATDILIYTSCYAAGANRKLGFEDEYKKQFARDQSILLQQTFSYPIILLAATEAVTTALSVRASVARLFDLLKQRTGNMPDYYTILKKSGVLTSSERTESGKRDIAIENFPQIRLPRTEWFSVAALNNITNNKDYAIISKVQGQTREKPLTIAETVKTIFIYTPIIPFTITIPQNMTQRIPRIVFMDVTNAHFAEINAPNLTFEGLCRLFMPLDAIISHKIFVDSLTFAEGTKKITLKECAFSLIDESSQGDEYVLFLDGVDSLTSKWTQYKALAKKKTLIESQAPLVIEGPNIIDAPYFNYLTQLNAEELVFKTIGQNLQKTLKPAK